MVIEPAQRLHNSISITEFPNWGGRIDSPAKNCAHKTGIFDDTPTEFLSVTLDDAVQDIAQKTFIISQKAAGAGSVRAIAGRRWFSVMVKVQLVNCDGAITAGTMTRASGVESHDTAPYGYGGT